MICGMEYERNEAIDLLGRTPRVLDAWLRGLPAGFWRGDEGDGTFSPFDVVGHLVWNELDDWIPRARLLLEHGERRAFEPFDRFRMRERDVGKTGEQLLDEFAALRAQNLDALRELVPSAELLDRTGRHPEFGVVTLRQLLATWVAHDQSHLAQIARVLGRQYGDAVGPWKAYLGIFRERA